MAAKFSPSDAAISVFSFAKSNLHFTLKYMAFFAIISFVSSAGLALGGFFEYSEFMNAIKLSGRVATQSDLQEALKLLNGPILILAILLSFVLGGIVSAIGLRKTLLNKDTGPQFGDNEKNILLGGLGLGLILFGIFFGGIIIISIIDAMIGAPEMQASPVLVIGMVAIILGCLFATGRYGQFGIFAVLENEFGLKKSYAYTKDGFWSFIGAYFLCGAILIILAIIVTQIISILLNFGLPDALFVSPPRAGSDFFKIGNMLYQLFSGAVSGFMNLGFICVGAYIYHQMGACEVTIKEAVK